MSAKPHPLSPPWIWSGNGDGTYAVLAAGRPGELIDRLTEDQARRLVEAANGPYEMGADEAIARAAVALKELDAMGVLKDRLARVERELAGYMAIADERAAQREEAIDQRDETRAQLAAAMRELETLARECRGGHGASNTSCLDLYPNPDPDGLGEMLWCFGCQARAALSRLRTP